MMMHTCCLHSTYVCMGVHLYQCLSYRCRQHSCFKGSTWGCSLVDLQWTEPLITAQTMWTTHKWVLIVIVIGIVIENDIMGLWTNPKLLCLPQQMSYCVDDINDIFGLPLPLLPIILSPMPSHVFSCLEMCPRHGRLSSPLNYLMTTFFFSLHFPELVHLLLSHFSKN